MQLAEGDVERPLIRPNLALAFLRQADSFAYADTVEAGEQQEVRKQVVGTAQFLL